MLMFLALTGCSLHHVQEARLEHRFERAGLQEHVAQVGSTTLHYWMGGEGEPLLLLHGFGGDAVWGWHPQLALARHHTLIVPDLVWFGASRSASEDFSLALNVDAVVRLLDHEGFTAPVDVTGISYGGLVAFQLAASHPDRVGRLVLVDSPGAVWTREDQTAMLARFDIGRAADLVVPEGPGGVRRLVELAYYDPPATPRFLLRDIYRHMFLSSVDEKRALLSALEEDPEALTSVPWTIPQPTLLVWGAEDPLFPVGVATRLAAAIGPQASVAVIPETAHAPNLEESEAFNEIVEAFLDRGPAR
jgi:pimeloyl-ACP methyl ester carboxylesterase